mmetsp:Transcript_24246/g.21348  ORF Transcript_24246/g.21348 Transcript_24246/m.21348 type:complete len:156 (-) Transcript_24246:105-572(-)|eukprot:CAMPEP_0114590448 /NCGR_PEP_ID=MMETSP0125-20121206/12708_1 /TAXON_ID=485358 ORGANISM="Aristerostoma sp., Strain ATCC 50986" /NCGR_SAMPLE_ID=MMETSP0125 /ASSEMBLY_ACC=CAM_ASM_000245 /LENGTH=155 /DNA_ID=CAMNT_0001787969 /DNA_START=191 /DNA_END=658 /DNA_ORIENTATION=-
MICQREWLHRRKEEEKDFYAYDSIFLKISVMFVLVALILIMILIFGTPDDNILIGIVVLLAIAGGITLVVVVRSYFRKPTFKLLENVIIQKLNAFFKVENEYYNNFGYRWEIEPEFYWLELVNTNYSARDQTEKENLPKISKMKVEMEAAAEEEK